MNKILKNWLILGFTLGTILGSAIAFILLSFKHIEFFYGMLITLGIQMELVIALMVYNEIHKIKYGDIK